MSEHKTNIRIGETRVYLAILEDPLDRIHYRHGGYRLVTRIDPPQLSTDILSHEGRKYLRRIESAVIPGESVGVDVYAVLEAFAVACPARQHAIKKLLCAGLRDKGSQLDDLIGASAAINRAIELERARSGNQTDEDCRLSRCELNSELDAARETINSMGTEIALLQQEITRLRLKRKRDA